jgi:GNAT superfamily N-acetyltransferase
MTLSIKTTSLAGVETAVAWAAQEGWNPGRSDATCFYAADPNGFFTGELDGRIVSTISAVSYGADFGFVGLYIVHPEHRGRGIGPATWRHALEPLADRNLALDGVVAQVAKYGTSGFVTAHRNVRYRVTGRHVAAGPGLPSIPAGARAAIRAFDRRFFPAERDAFLDAWLTQPGIETCCDESDDGVRGYGVMRPCLEGWKIGPLFARTAESARRILETLLDRSAGQAVFLDVPDDHPDAVALVRRGGFTPVFETARMYTRGRPRDVDWSGVYGITTFELG